MGIDDYTGSELNMLEANLSRKIRGGDATPTEIQQYNMVSKRMGNVNVPIERARARFADITGHTPASKHHRRRHRHKKGKKHHRGKK